MHDLHPIGLFSPTIAPDYCRFVFARLTRSAESIRAGKFADIFLKRLTFSAGCAMIIRLQSTHAPVAQLDRVSDSDSEGHRFESCRAYRRKPLANQRFARGFVLLFFAGTAGLVHCLVHQRSFFMPFSSEMASLSRCLSCSLPPCLRMDGMTSWVIQCLKALASGFREPRTREYSPGSLMIVAFGFPEVPCVKCRVFFSSSSSLLATGGVS